MRRFFEARKLHMNRLNTHGFTMAEVLMTVAILGILAAVTFMGVFTIQRNMSQTRADKSAELIFEAAQRQMVSINAFDVQGQKDVSATSMLCAVPGDSRDPLPELLLKDQVADDLYHDGWIVEYDNTSMQVKAVFYFEEGDMGFYNDASQKAAIASGRSARINYLKDNGQLVGYFEGETSSYSSSDLKVSAKLDVQNKEELVADAGIVVSGDLPDAQKYKIVVTTEGLTSGAKVTQEVELSNNDLGAMSGKRTASVHILLDSLKTTEKRFRYTYGNISANGTDFLKDTTDGYITFNNITTTASITCAAEDASKNFIPGEDLLISLTAQTLDGALTDTTSYLVNSLYEKADSSEDNYIASVAYGRHLQNLDTQTSGFDLTSFAGSQAANKVTYNHMIAKQTATIDFSSADSEWIKTYGTSQKKFRPITNTKLEEFYGGTEMGRYEIFGLLVDSGNKSYAGLFAEYFGTKIENVTLVNEKIKGASTTMTYEAGKWGSIGGLVGKVAGGGTKALTINGCQVYMDEDVAKEGLTNAKANWMNHAICIGGLVGYANRPTSISYSSASTVITDASYAGGLVGYSETKVDLQHSYADCYIGGNNIGGLVASCGETSTIRGCYSAGFVIDPTYSTNGAVAGIAPCAVATLRDVYTTFDFGNGSEYTGTRFYPTVSVVTNAGELANTYYVNAGFDIPWTNKVGDKRSLATLKDKSKTGFLAGTFAYASDGAYARSTASYKLSATASTTNTYLYPVVIVDETTALNHYGDWRDGLRIFEVRFWDAGQLVQTQNVTEYTAVTTPTPAGAPANAVIYWQFTYEGEAYYYVPALGTVYQASLCQTNIANGIAPWTAVAPAPIDNPLAALPQTMDLTAAYYIP